MESHLKINFHPTSFELIQIKEFLFEEDEKFKEGFYCNWHLIEEAYNNKRIISFHFKDQCIGFVEWRDGDFVIDIDRFEIRREFRKRGLGKYLFENIFESFKTKKAKTIKLYCYPIESQWFWKKVGFVQFPETDTWKKLTFYKNIIEAQEPINNPFSFNKVELWNLEPSEIKEHKPKWCWDLNISDKPIIQPCNYKWQLKYTKNGKVIYEGALGRFSDTCNQVFFYPFLFIEN